MCSYNPKMVSEIETRGSDIFFLKVTFKVTLNCVEGMDPFKVFKRKNKNGTPFQI